MGISPLPSTVSMIFRPSPCWALPRFVRLTFRHQYKSAAAIHSGSAVYMPTIRSRTRDRQIAMRHWPGYPLSLVKWSYGGYAAATTLLMALCVSLQAADARYMPVTAERIRPVDLQPRDWLTYGRGYNEARPAGGRRSRMGRQHLRWQSGRTTQCPQRTHLHDYSLRR